MNGVVIWSLTKNPDLADKGVKDFVEPLLRDDFRLVENYPTNSTKLSCPLLAIKSKGDTRVNVAHSKVT